MSKRRERDVIVKALSSLTSHLESAAVEIREALGELAPEQAIPRIDLGDLDAAPWLNYRTKTPASPGSAAWMKNPAHFTQFEPPPVIFELVKAVKKSPGEKLVLGDCEYSFSKNGMFIQRKPVKVRSRRGGALQTGPPVPALDDEGTDGVCQPHPPRRGGQLDRC